MSLRLVAAGGDRSFDLPRGRSYTLGRSAQCDLPVRDPTVSRLHAELAPDGAALRVRDLGSTNGTFLNGKRVEEGVARDGDTLAFGRLGFALEELTSESAATGEEELLDATILRQVPVRAPGEPAAPGSGTMGGLGTVNASVLRRAGSEAERQALQLALLLDIAKDAVAPGRARPAAREGGRRRLRGDERRPGGGPDAAPRARRWCRASGAPAARR